MDYNGLSGDKKLLYSKLADQIQHYIKEQKLQPGDKLPGERKLAEEWKVSRATVREAIRELENHGIVSAEVGKGTFVADFAEGRLFSIHLVLKNFLELFEIKTVLERYSLEKAIPDIPVERLDFLEETAVQMNAMAATGFMPKEMDHRFHRYLAESYGNQEMANVISNMIEMYETFDEELYAYFEGQEFDYNVILLQTFPYHLEMVQMMKERNVPEALSIYDKIVELDLKIYGRIE